MPTSTATSDGDRSQHELKLGQIRTPPHPSLNVGKATLRLVAIRTSRNLSSATATAQDVGKCRCPGGSAKGTANGISGGRRRRLVAYQGRRLELTAAKCAEQLPRWPRSGKAACCRCSRKGKTAENTCFEFDEVNIPLRCRTVAGGASKRGPVSLWSREAIAVLKALDLLIQAIPTTSSHEHDDALRKRRGLGLERDELHGRVDSSSGQSWRWHRGSS